MQPQPAVWDDKERFRNFILIAPFLGYLASYFYEVGFANYFGIPTEWIVIELKSVIVAMTQVILFGLWAIQFLDTFLIPLRKTVGKQPHPLAWRLKFLMISVVVIIVYFLICPDLLVRKTGWIFPLGLLAYAGVFEFLLPLLTQHEFSGYIAKLEEQDKTDDQHPSSISIASKARPSLFALTAFAGLCAVFAYGVGRNSALNETEFCVVHDQVDYALLRKYGDAIVMAPFQKNSAAITGPLVLTTIQQHGPLSVERVKLGRIRRS